MTIEEIKSRLIKIKELANNGVGGEKVNAEKLLKKLLYKYKITENDIKSDVLQMFTLTFRSKLERRLLMQVIVMVRNSNQIEHRIYRKQVDLKLSVAEYLEISEIYDIYRKELDKNIETLFLAFIFKNKIHRTNHNDDTKTELTTEEERALFQMMRGFDSTPIIKKRIEA